MGIGNLEEIVNQLMESNYTPNTPIGIIESGTTRNQKVRTSTLNKIIEDVIKDPIKTPALIIIGDVVKYREKLHKHYVKIKQSN